MPSCSGGSLPRHAVTNHTPWSAITTVGAEPVLLIVFGQGGFDQDLTLA